MWKSLADKAYRQAYSIAHVGDYLAMQLHSMRQQRGWTQKELAEASDATQPQISNYETSCEGVNLTTLHKLAGAFDVALLVKFVPFSQLAKETVGARADTFIPSFDEDSPEAIRSSNLSIQMEAPTRKRSRKNGPGKPYVSRFENTGSALFGS